MYMKKKEKTLENKSNNIKTRISNEVRLQLPIIHFKYLKKLAEDKNFARDPEAKPEQLETLIGLGEDVDRLLAEHPKATANLLAKLSMSHDWITCRNVVLNPNTSRDVLLKLAPRFPMDFFRNPAFDWWLLEEPDLLFKIGKGVLKNILKREECPESFMKWAAKNGNDQERLVLAIKPKVPVAVLKDIINTGGAVGILAEAILSGNTNSLHRMPDSARDSVLEPNVLEEVLKLPECPLLLMKWAVGNGIWSEKMSLAMNPNTPIDLLKLMAEEGGEVADAAKSHRKLHSSSISEDPKVVFENVVKKAVFDLRSNEAKDAWRRGWIGRNQWIFLAPSCRLSVLGIEDFILLESEWLSTYSEMLLRGTQPGSIQQQLPPVDLPADHFKKLARSKDSETRMALAQSISTPIEALTILAKDKNVQVLRCVASNPSTPADLLELIAQSKSKTVLEAVASNPLTPKPSLEKLVKDDDFEIRKRAAVSLSSPELFVRICSEFAVSRLKQIASEYSVNHWHFKEMDDARESGLMNEFLADEYHRLLEEPEASLMAKFVVTDYSYILGVPQPGPDYGVSLAVRLLGLCDPGARPVALVANFKSTDWLDRLAIARNPKCPQNIRATLKRDGHEMVAKMARAMDLSESAQENSDQNTLPNHGEDSHMEDAKISSPCPNCKGTVKEDNGNYGCCGVEGAASGCGFSFNKTQAGRPFKPAEVELLLREHKSGLLRGFISKAGKPFNAEMVLRFDEAKKTCRVVFDFVKDKKPESVVLSAVLAADAALQPSLGACPKCSAAVHAHGTNYVCINSMVSPAQAVPSCDFKTGQVILQQAISTEQLGKLLASGRTDLLDGFISARTQKAFKAMLVWDGTAGKVSFEFGSSRA